MQSKTPRGMDREKVENKKFSNNLCRLDGLPSAEEKSSEFVVNRVIEVCEVLHHLFLGDSWILELHLRKFNELLFN